MSIVFASNSALDTVGRAVKYTGTPQSRDPDFASEEILVNMISGSSDSAFRVYHNGGVDNVWLHFRFKTPSNIASNGADGNILGFGAGSIVDFASGIDIENGFIRARVFSTYGAPFELSNDTVYTFDVHYTFAEEVGTIEVYVDGVLVSEATDETNQHSQVPVIVFDLQDAHGSGFNYLPFYFSEILIDDEESTIGKRVATLNAAGVGALSDWTGDHTSLENVADLNALYADGADQKSSFTLEAYSGPTTGTISGIFVNSHAAVGAQGPTEVEDFIRVNGENYGGGLDQLAVGQVVRRRSSFPINPDTLQPWDFSDLASLQFGFSSGDVADAPTFQFADAPAGAAISMDYTGAPDGVGLYDNSGTGAAFQSVGSSDVVVQDEGMVFDGDCYLKYTSGSLSGLGSDDFTITLVANISDIPTLGQYKGVISQWGLSNDQYSFLLRQNQYVFQFLMSGDGSGSDFSVSCNTNGLRYTDFEIVIERVGDTVTMYLNGVEADSVALDPGFTFNPEEYGVEIGTYGNEQFRSFTGLIKKFSIVTGTPV